MKRIRLSSHRVDVRYFQMDAQEGSTARKGLGGRNRGSGGGKRGRCGDEMELDYLRDYDYD
eukprot:3271048-Rhodomonas_salina.1